MTEVVLYHHVQGLTEGVRSFADELRQELREALIEAAMQELRGELDAAVLVVERGFLGR